MTYEGEEVPLAYISGACTTPEERGKDWMRRLINEAFEEMERRGVALTALIPANRGLFDFYGNFGYAEVFRYSLEAYTFPDSPPSRSDIKVSIPINPYDHVWFAYLDRKLHEYPACVLHSYDDYQTIVSDALLSGERLYIAIHKEKEIAGMAFARCEEKSEDVYIKALFCDSPEAGKAIAQEAAMRNKVWSALIQAPPTDSGSFSYGMANEPLAGSSKQEALYEFDAGLSVRSFTLFPTP